MSDPEFTAFEVFSSLRKGDLIRIARRCGEATENDVANEAWLLARELTKKHNQDPTFYFSDPVGQRTLLGYLFNRFVRYRETKIRNSIRLEWTEVEQPERYDSIVAAASIAKMGDPLRILLAEESPKKGYEPSPHDTETGAYLRLLELHGGSMRALAESLNISLSHCYRRRRRAREICKVQQPLFNGTAHDDRSPLGSWRQPRLNLNSTPKGGKATPQSYSTELPFTKSDHR